MKVFFFLATCFILSKNSVCAQVDTVKFLPDKNIIRPTFFYGDDSMSLIIFNHVKDIPTMDDSNSSKIYSFQVDVDSLGKIKSFKRNFHASSIINFDSNLNLLIKKIDKWKPAYILNNINKKIDFYRVNFLLILNTLYVKVLLSDENNILYYSKEIRK